MVTSSAPLVRKPEEEEGAGATSAGGVPDTKQPQVLAMCKVHGRKRLVDYLAECEDGTFTCAGENECRIPTAHLRGPRVVNWYYCECCLFVLNSLRQYSLHTRGGRHQHKVRALSEAYAKTGLVFEPPPARVVPEGSERAAVLRMLPPPHVAEMHALASASFPRISQLRMEAAAAGGDGTAADVAAAADTAPDLRRVSSGGGTSRSARKRQRRRRVNEQRAADRLREAEDQAAMTASSGATRAESSCESVRVVDLATLNASGDVIFELDAWAADPALLREPAACRTGTAPVLCPDYDSSSPTSTLFSLSELGARRAQSAGCLLSDVAAALEEDVCKEDDVRLHCAASAPSLLATVRGQRAAGSAVAAAAPLPGPAATAPALQVYPQHVRVSYHSLIANSILLENPAGHYG